MSDVNLLEATVRTEFGKGAARRTRRAGNVPAVLYGHQTDPQHLAVDAQAFAAILRQHGANAVINLVIEGKQQLALTKSVVMHPIRRYIEHADLLIVQRGEQVTAEVPVTLTGEAGPGTLVTQELTTVAVSADALNLPESIEVNIHNLAAGTQITAGALELPSGVSLADNPELLIVNIIEAPSAAATGEAEAAEAESAE
ncbi:50S ribosomal protein L25/general stress protein Ctc [Nocardia donostiensis]|uniref:Large ribosomal subunit protein bL25 n=1 Tax=Nocardia donostiensis TaxID=1538463 RepID=A0A1V2TFL1_9NOCA|nr:50S ribosomal protein L25/general stress protein Ctc [Nocardia donostiensis]ONM48300.1 50S ribosomal protein L25/general stress protein Ctc [Nocardia donostiensis]OQS14505.1 50S ribosomal protein L25/general stress protein Ctc [Nocardia donostiensis]OQS20590.1 50S ribosomal protein L25/general stress protein Ctc [Nocardia donostiensis]